MKCPSSKIQYGAVVKFQAVMGYLLPYLKGRYRFPVSQMFSTLLGTATIGICNFRIRPFTDQISDHIRFSKISCFV